MKEIIPESGYKEYNIGEYQLWIFEKPSYISPLREQCLACNNKSERSEWHNCHIWKNPGEKGSYKGVFCIDCTAKHNLEKGDMRKMKSGLSVLRIRNII